MDYTALSKEISYALRHAPWEYELELDDEGFVPVAQLLDALNEGSGYGRAVTEDDLRHIIATSEKKRHEIVGDRIRALYGHTTPHRILREPCEPPEVLYHGTTHKAWPKIQTDGLKPMKRQYVHLSVDTKMAHRVGSRRDPEPVILRIDARRAHADGVVFYRGNDAVWLADAVPAEYLAKMQ